MCYPLKIKTVIIIIIIIIIIIVIIMDVITFPENLLTISGLKILLHGVATLYDKDIYF